MAQEPKTIHVDQASELARVLAEADDQPVRLTTGNLSYRVTREDEGQVQAGDSAAINAAIDRLAGSWSSDDADAAIAYIYRAREEGSRPATRP
ncbi:MAG: hypothetical protein JOZ41_20700 [Chloroflexi bacterium]|nr:hypothetical protein [Chloroflexota bacterium]